MDPRHLHNRNGLDERLAAACCAHCGGQPDTVDHVPSRVLLDDPLPDDLPIVPACRGCNRGFSVDEEYLACLIECVVVGTADPEQRHRPKIQQALRHNPKLAKMIARSASSDPNGHVVWTPDLPRVQNVVLKLARGHVLYELSYAQIETPSSISCCPLVTMASEALDGFELADAGQHRWWPEIGSRAFLRAAGARPYSEQSGPWVSVQSGRYRYSVDDNGGPHVRMVLSEYLACCVKWN